MIQMWVKAKKKNKPKAAMMTSHGPDGSNPGLMVCISEAIKGYISNVTNAPTSHTTKSTPTARVC